MAKSNKTRTVPDATEKPIEQVEPKNPTIEERLDADEAEFRAMRRDHPGVKGDPPFRQAGPDRRPGSSG